MLTHVLSIGFCQKHLGNYSEFLALAECQWEEILLAGRAECECGC